MKVFKVVSMSLLNNISKTRELFNLEKAVEREKDARQKWALRSELLVCILKFARCVKNLRRLCLQGL
jgi:hypothetical protein